MDTALMLRTILVPFAGTALGAACVFLLKRSLGAMVQRVLTGFAAGVMVAASVWSLLIPALEGGAALGAWSFVPALVGLWVGVLFLLLLDHVVPHLHQNADEPSGTLWSVTASTSLVDRCQLAAALALAVGLAIQNFPEGAIVSMPLHGNGMAKGKAFGLGVASGVVEPVAALVTIAAASVAVPLLPYLLGFAAGAMLYVVVEELIPEMSQGRHSNAGTLMFAVGFSLMMVLDVALG